LFFILSRILRFAVFLIYRAVCFGLAFRNLETKQAFYLMASCICISGASAALIFVKGHAGMLAGRDTSEVIAAWKQIGAPTAATTLEIPQLDAAKAAELTKERYIHPHLVEEEEA
jgi:NNP family nitrate/nitrite transporter-like MFS transporter